ncbi:MAG: universal stress protein [Anaerolineales bacterium]|nr:universal stress protein [Anaerolineales bacterium]MCB8951514.1 universal stress protein [Ardenticatenales bacterium]
MSDSLHTELHSALEDFQRARRRAFLQDIVGRLTGRQTQLLSYDDVRPLVSNTGVVARGLQEIPLDAIVGSVGRYEDFTRSFLPRSSSDAQRWARVRMAITEMTGLPPIEVYKVGEVYFVLDGNHRVSVAQEIGSKTISAYVTEVRTRLPVSPDDGIDELICKARYADFLEDTQLPASRPEADLRMTACGRYRVLEEQIEAWRRQMCHAEGREVSTQEAAVAWYDTAYTPVREVICEQGVLRDFPERTEADLYVWLVQHQEELREKLGWRIGADTAALDLTEQHGTRPPNVLTRMSERLRDALRERAAPGQWRRERLAVRRRERLFADVLVPLPDVSVDGLAAESPWPALTQALLVAQRESSMVHGLHVIPPDWPSDEEKIAQMRRRFTEICAQAQVSADFVVETGEIARHISQRARWIDLVIINMSYPPAAQPLVRLGSGFHTIVQQTSRPILAVPRQERAPLRRALLAYNASLKANEALFLAAYLAQRWNVTLAVVVVAEDETMLRQTNHRASEYLAQQGVRATFVPKTGAVSAAILETAAAQMCDFIIMGGYSYTPPLELVLGSAVNEVLRGTRWPVLICR